MNNKKKKRRNGYWCIAIEIGPPVSSVSQNARINLYFVLFSNRVALRLALCNF